MEITSMQGLLGVGIELPRKMQSVMLRFILIFVLFTFAAAAQTRQSPTPETPARRGGFLVHQTALFGQYYSTGSDVASAVLAPGMRLASDIAAGGAAAVGYLRMAERTQFSLSYRTAYIGRLRYSELNGLNHFLDLRVDHRLRPSTRVGFAANSAVSSTEEFAFTPTELSLLASVGGNAEDLARAARGQQFGDSYLAARLSGAHDSDSAVRLLLFGNRVLNTSVQTSFSHAFSSRMIFSGGVGAVRRQHIGDGDAPDGRPRNLLPQMTSGNASVALSYSASPRTQFGFSVESMRGQSQLQDSYATLSRVSVQRMMGPRWFVAVNGGLASVIGARQIPSASTGPGYVAGGSLGYRSYAHSVLLSHDRSVADTYGLAASSSHVTSFAWQWQVPRRQWSLAATGTRHEASGVLPVTSWRGLAEVRRSLHRHAAISLQYSYLTYSQRIIQASTINLSSVRVVLMWSPQL
jgi:hypothetical protein